MKSRKRIPKKQHGSTLPKHLFASVFLGALLVFVSVLFFVVFVQIAVDKENNESFQDNTPVILQLRKILFTDIIEHVVYHGDRQKKLIALTFDADMTEGMKQLILHKKTGESYDKRIVDTLLSTKTDATFFLSGLWIEMYPKLARDFAETPLFELGNHSYSHPSFFGFCYGLPGITGSQKETEIKKTQALLKSLTGHENTLFRFPGGCFDTKDLVLTNQLHLSVIQWDVVSGDAFGTNAERIVKQVLNRTGNGSIIVMHLNGAPNAPKTAEALPEIIKKLKANWEHFVRMRDRGIEPMTTVWKTVVLPLN